VLLRRGDRNPGLTAAMYDEPIDTTRELCNDPQRNRVERSLEPALREHLRDRLPAYMEPAVFVLLPALPMTLNGKIDRRALPIPDAKPTVEDDLSLTATQRLLRAIWQRLLGAREFGINDSFLSVGGDSLSVVSLAAEIHQHFDTDLDWAELQGSTLATLAERIELRIAERTSLAAQLQIDPRTQASREVLRL
jgi:acyl carrier protein